MVRASVMKLLMIPVLLWCGITFAESGSFGELDKLQKERFIFEVKAALNKAKQDAGNYNDSKKDASEATVAAASNQQKELKEPLPSLIKINGRKAVILLSNGSSRSVTVGEMLPGGRYQVHSVNMNGVSVRQITDGKIIPLS
ncbi:type IV pilus biogenesis protein PilP [Enterobacter sp. EC-ML 621]|uniref:type IV pilus biogenesis protein PilP n=1 Tax=Enterobacter sp. EC-ML 621 TaxID=3037555 RepID=UPI002853E925|nr:type IV pilus biogenesis protein PilP [Enterobacter sp. EC-ML 621]MDR5095806.1 type IV pilus biogenesis protein PilP [Enterobacter sp. EC-ML 621]